MKYVRVICATLSLTLLTACSSSDPAPGKTAQELRAIMSHTNGLYFSPHLLVERGSITDVIAAVATDHSLGVDTELRLSSATQTGLRQEALDTFGSQAYGQLAPLYRAGATAVLRPSDAVTLRKRHRADGSYTPSGGSSGMRARVQATGSALAALQALDLLPETTQQSLSWLRKAANSRDSTTSLLALRAIRTIRPHDTPPYHGDRPDLRNIGSKKDSERSTAVEVATLYVNGVGATTAGPALDCATVRKLYQENVATSDFPTLLELVTLMRACGAHRSELAAARTRLTTSRLPDGLYRNTSEDFGSSIATVYALRLMRMRGESTRSSKLADSLMTYLGIDQVRTRPTERLIALGASVVAGRKKSAEKTKSLCHNSSVVPTTVDQENAVGWAELTQICAEAGTRSPAPAFRPWPARNPEAIVDQAVLVDALILTGREKLIPGWIDKAAMRRLLLKSTSSVSLLQAALVGTAYLHFSNGDDRELLDSLRTRADKARGCPHLPSLYRTSDTDPSCDLRTTIAVENFLSA